MAALRCIGVRVLSLVLLALLVASAMVAGVEAATSPPSASAPNIVRNGNFALSPADPEIANVGPGSSYTIHGWSSPSVGVQDAGTSVFTMPGGESNAVKLYWQGVSSVTQTIATVPGTTYKLQWWGAAEPDANFKINAIWNGSTIASPSFVGVGATATKLNWKQETEIVTATSTSSTLEFADGSPPQAQGYGPLVTGVTLAGDATIYLPKTISVTPTGKIIAVVRNGTNSTLTVGGLSVKLYGTTQTVSYAPAVTELLATAPVAQGQATLQLHLAKSLVGKTVSAYAILTGPDYLPDKVTLTLKVG